MKLDEILLSMSQEFGIELNTGQIDKFVAYYELLVDWNRKVNLTSLETPEEFVIKHVMDSLSCYDANYFPGHASVIDIGTGAGFPGVPLKIFRDDINLLLLDSLAKRVNFLNILIDQLALTAVQAIQFRAEDGARQAEYREGFDIACSRAVARLPVLLEYCLPFVKVGGYFVALKGAQYSEELAEAKTALKALGGGIAEVKLIKLPGIEDTRALIFVEKLEVMDDKYPRRAGQIKKKHL